MGSSIADLVCIGGAIAIYTELDVFSMEIKCTGKLHHTTIETQILAYFRQKQKQITGRRLNMLKRDLRRRGIKVNRGFRPL